MLMLKRNIFSVIMAPFFLCMVGCEKEQPDTTTVTRPVKVMTVGESTSKRVRNFPGKVIASQRADLSFEVPGLLIELPILEGNNVEEGALIAKLDPEVYQEAVNETEARYVRAKAQFERAEQLIKNKYLSESDYDTIKSTYLVAESDLNRAKRDLADTQILAPFDGIIAQKYVDNFQRVQIHQKIATLHDTSHIDIEVDVPENLMVKIKQGNAETLTEHIKAIFDAEPDKLYPVSFKEATTEADPETQTYRIVFNMPTPKNINVLPGMTVTIRSDISETQNATKSTYYLVPSSAVFSETQASYVWKVNAQTMEVTKSKVTVGRLTGDNIQIKSGLSSGDIIVTAGVHFLRENQKVTLLGKEKE